MCCNSLSGTHPGSSEDDDVARPADQSDHVAQGVDVTQLLPARRLAQQLDHELTEQTQRAGAIVRQAGEVADGTHRSNEALKNHMEFNMACDMELEVFFKAFWVEVFFKGL